MILFYDKNSGEIQGTIYGRLHSAQHLAMWIGGDNTKRLVVDWILTENKTITEYIPNTPQKELFIMLDKNPEKISEYKVDINTEFLVKK